MFLLKIENLGLLLARSERNVILFKFWVVLVFLLSASLDDIVSLD